MGLIDEISTKTIHIKEKNRGNVFIYLPTGHYEVAPCSFDHIRNDKCPNDSRRIMPFVASVSFWFFLVLAQGREESLEPYSIL